MHAGPRGGRCQPWPTFSATFLKQVDTHFNFPPDPPPCKQSSSSVCGCSLAGQVVGSPPRTWTDRCARSALGLRFPKLAGLDLLAQSLPDHKHLNVHSFLHPERAYLDQLSYTRKTEPVSISHLRWALNDLFFRSLEGWVYCLYSLMRKQAANRWIRYITVPRRCAVWKTVVFLAEEQREYTGMFCEKPLINRFVSSKSTLHP